ncbi:MAG: hypothetical protein WCA46_26510 [Actinocatenispora sp.]
MGTLSVEVEALIANGRERYEDSYTCDTLNWFLQFCADVPATAWGRFDWSDRWSKDWHTAAEAREDEARTARDVQGHTGAALYQVAADYSHTDIDISLTFDISDQNAALRPWLAALHGNGGGGTVHPGGKVDPPAPYSGGNYTVAIAPENPDEPSDVNTRMQYAFLDHSLNQDQLIAPGTVTPLMRARETLLNTPGCRALWTFINEHYPELQQAEEILAQYGMAPDNSPARDFIDDAKDAVPGIIINRAELVGVVKNEYDELTADMVSDTDNLKAYWYSPGGATAYFTHANTLIKYYQSLSEQAGWFHDEGKKAGNAIDSLQLAYSKVGYDLIGDVIDRLEAYLDALDDITSNIDDPVKALASAVSAMGKAMLSKWQQANSDAQSTLQISEAAQDDAPDLGDTTHGPVPFPESGVPNNGWKHPDQWSPNQNPLPPETAG